jgi:hypothetical protein
VVIPVKTGATGGYRVEGRNGATGTLMAWRASWSAPELAVHSNPAAYTRSDEFAALERMGPEIIPLVVQRLAEPENFLALQLYDRLTRDSDMMVAFEPDADHAIEGEQGRAFRTVQRFLESRG